jgi:hypothetical protein
MTQDWLTILVLAATGPVAAFVALHAYARWSIRHIDDPQTDGHDYVDTDLVDARQPGNPQQDVYPTGNLSSGSESPTHDEVA